MYIFDVENKSLLKDVLLENLKILGVRCRLPKKIKENEKENVFSNNQIFQKPLNLLKKCCTNRLDGSELEIPEFIVDACGVIEKDIQTEGIFRKAGSTCKQKERKLELNQGKKVNCQYHVLDACSLVKLFFRELPQPILPYGFHDIFLKCLLLPTYEKELDALMLACLLLPEENLATLAFFMEFLLKVSWHADKNKMTVKNLAIILTPTLMPVSKGTRASNNLEMTHHFKVIEMLIENAKLIGRVPDQVVETLATMCSKKSKKKRRSGSITRMFTGLKKIVGSRSLGNTEWDDSIVSTPETLPSLRKRKNSESTTTKVNLSTKKKPLTDSSSVGILTPLRCRMHGYASSLAPNQSPSKVKRFCTQSPGDAVHQKHCGNLLVSERGRQEARTSRLNLVNRCTTKKQKSQSKLVNAKIAESLLNFEEKKISIIRKLSVINWEPKKVYSCHLLTNNSENQGESPEGAVDLSDGEFITIPKSEYEDIKNRVSALEEDLENLNEVRSVQQVYERTLEESERLSEGPTEFLATKLSRELKIRRSCENKVIRSPSARKIGSIRRRSRETVQKVAEPKSNLKRGRPNTLQTGLPSPRLRTLSNDNFPTPKKVLIARAATFRETRDEWKSGEMFFAKEQALQRLTPASQGRLSIAEIRCQNAGMVLEKAKLFNSLTESNGAGARIPRRQSVRVENLRRMNDAEKSLKKNLTRTRSLGSEKKEKASQISMLESTGTEEACTPKLQKLAGGRRETPSIKKPLMARSPRSLAKTPVSHARSGHRSRATPLKALMEVAATPHIGSRRSPRILARSSNTPTRLKD